MRYIKRFGPLLIAAAALMALAGSASATSLTSPAGTTYTSTIKATSEHVTLTGSFTTVTCTSSVMEGKVESHGASVTAGGKVSRLEFSGCNHPVTVFKAGSLEVHTAGSTSNGNGTLTSAGAEVVVHTSVGTCTFTTSATDIGVVTGSTNVNAILDIDGATIPRTGGAFFCGSSGVLSANYLVTTPSTLYVH